MAQRNGGYPSPTLSGFSVSDDSPSDSEADGPEKKKNGKRKNGTSWIEGQGCYTRGGLPGYSGLERSYEEEEGELGDESMIRLVTELEKSDDPNKRKVGIILLATFKEMASAPTCTDATEMNSSILSIPAHRHISVPKFLRHMSNVLLGELPPAEGLYMRKGVFRTSWEEFSGDAQSNATRLVSHSPTLHKELLRHIDSVDRVKRSRRVIGRVTLLIRLLSELLEQIKNDKIGRFGFRAPVAEPNSLLVEPEFVSGTAAILNSMINFALKGVAEDSPSPHQPKEFAAGTHTDASSVILPPDPQPASSVPPPRTESNTSAVNGETTRTTAVATEGPPTSPQSSPAAPKGRRKRKISDSSKTDGDRVAPKPKKAPTKRSKKWTDEFINQQQNAFASSDRIVLPNSPAETNGTHTAYESPPYSPQFAAEE